MRALISVILLWVAFLAAPGHAQDDLRLVGARVTGTEDQARLVLDLSAPTHHTVHALDRPNRLVVEFNADEIDLDVAGLPAVRGLAIAYTLELAGEGLARAILFLGDPAKVTSARTIDAFDDQPHRLVIDIEPDTAAGFAAQVAEHAERTAPVPTPESELDSEPEPEAEPERAEAEPVEASAPGVPVRAAEESGAGPPLRGAITPQPAAPAGAEVEPTPDAGTQSDDPTDQIEQEPVEVAEAEPVAPAAPTGLEGFPGLDGIPIAGPEIARPLVIIDPGHGGIDGGATGYNGVKEKDVTLSFALMLQEMMIEDGHFDVALTRDSDRFVSLEDRVTMARVNKADLFISLHADTFEQADVRGASVYTRDENATDVLDKVLAAKENRVDLIAGFAPPEDTDAVVDILVDLMRRETRRRSFVAAQAVVAELDLEVRMRRFPLRQADFFVLQSPEVPSFLLELGFLSNREDATNLARDEWQRKVADALVKAITGYFAATGRD